MRRYQLAVKLCRRLLGLVSDDQLRIHAHVLTTIKSGESCDTPVPPDAPACPPAPEGVAGRPSEHRPGLPAAFQARPLHEVPYSTSELSLPRLGVGAGN